MILFSILFFLLAEVFIRLLVRRPNGINTDSHCR